MCYSYKTNALVSIPVVLMLLFSPLMAQDSLNISRLGSVYNFWDYVHGLLIEEGIAYVAAGYSGLQIVDIADPEVPEIIGSFDSIDLIPAWGESFWQGTVGLAISGNYLFAASREGLYVFDVRLPYRPTIATHLPDFRESGDIVIHNNYLYIPDSYSGLQVFDISRPDDPVLVNNIPREGYLLNVNLSANLLLVTAIDQSDGLISQLVIYSLENPALPVELGYISLPFAGETCFNDATTINEYVVTVGDSLRVIDTSYPIEPRIIATLPLKSYKIVSDNQYAYCTDRGLSLNVIDISPRPRIVAQMALDNNNRAFDLQLDNRYIFVTDSDYHIIVCDLNNLFEPRRVNHFPEFSAVNKVFADYRMAYFADDRQIEVSDSIYSTHKIRVVDIQNRNRPVEVNRFVSFGRLCALSNNHLYFARGDTGMGVINVSRSWQPREVGVEFSRSNVRDIAVQGNYAYIAAAQMNELPFRLAGLQILDISVPSHHNEIGFASFNRGAPSPSQVAVSGNLASLFIPTVGIRLYDVSDKYRPTLISSIQSPGNREYRTTITQDHLYLWFGQEMHIYNIRNLEEPSFIRLYRPRGWLRDVTAVDSLLFLSLNNFGLQILDLTNPLNPVEVGYYDTPGLTLATTIVDNFVVVADKTNLGLYDCSSLLPSSTKFDIPEHPASSSLISLYPNPFNASATITLNIQQPGFFRLMLSDITGRDYRTLIDGNFASGTQTLKFDSGNYPSGSYFVKFIASDGKSSVIQAQILR